MPDNLLELLEQARAERDVATAMALLLGRVLGDLVLTTPGDFTIAEAVTDALAEFDLWQTWLEK